MRTEEFRSSKITLDIIFSRLSDFKTSFALFPLELVALDFSSSTSLLFLR